MAWPESIVLCLLVGLVPPLTESQHERLALAHDDRDHQEEAFVALCENVRQWPAAPLDPRPPQPDLEVMLGIPEVFRGRLYLLEGTLVQQETLPPPHETVQAWFLRTEAGTPVLVYVTAVDPDLPLRIGQRLELPARFYKRITMTARDGEERRYGAFVGAHPRAAAAPSIHAQYLWVITIPIVIMLVVFLALLVYARRRPRITVARRGGAAWDEPEPDEGPPLPDDPVEALAELRRRAGADSDEPA